MNKADQTDILAQLEQTTAELNTARQTISTLQAQVTALTTERDTTKETNATLTQERNSFRAENDRLKSEKEDFNKRLAAELAKHGIRNSGEETKPESKESKKLTADERVALAKAKQAAK